MIKLPDIGLVGLNHKTANIETREVFSFPENKIASIYKKLNSLGAKESVYLSTCNRVEIYFVADNVSQTTKKIINWLKSLSNFPDDFLKDKFYFFSEEEAGQHLLTVASSLDSMVIGENEIVGQLKKAFTIAVNQKKTGPFLNKLFHQAFKTAKEVRSKTNISRNPLSIAYIATNLANSLFPDLSARKALLVGAGEMGELILKYLAKSKIKSITIANRSLNNAERISEKINTKSKIILLDDIEVAAEKVDIIISSISIPHYLITFQMIENIMAKRKNKPLFLIDISVPRNIDPKINSLDAVHLYNIDDLKSIADKNLTSRLREVDLVQIVIESNLKEFVSWLGELQVVPTINTIQEQFDLIRKKELERYRSKKLKHLSKKDFSLIEELTNQIMTKTLHNPIANLKRHHKKSKGDQPESEILKRKTKFVEDLFTK